MVSEGVMEKKNKNVNNCSKGILIIKLRGEVQKKDYKLNNFIIGNHIILKLKHIHVSLKLIQKLKNDLFSLETI